MTKISCAFFKAKNSYLDWQKLGGQCSAEAINASLSIMSHFKQCRRPYSHWSHLLRWEEEVWQEGALQLCGSQVIPGSEGAIYQTMASHSASKAIPCLCFCLIFPIKMWISFPPPLFATLQQQVLTHVFCQVAIWQQHYFVCLNSCLLQNWVRIF